MTPWDALGWALDAAVVIVLITIFVALSFVARFVMRLDREDREFSDNIEDQRARIRRQRERFKL